MLPGRWRIVLSIAAVAFALSMTASCDSPTEPSILILFVAAEQVVCYGPFERQCLLVRSDRDSEWEYFYDAIDGFTWEEGYTYTIRVLRTRTRHPPLDGSAYRYRLLGVLEKKRS
jgi:hypothetical protein